MVGSKSYLGRTCLTLQHIPLPAKYCHLSVCPALLSKPSRAGGTEERMWCQDREQPPAAAHGSQTAGHPRNTCCAPGLWLHLYSSSCSGFPAALGLQEEDQAQSGQWAFQSRARACPHPFLSPETQHCCTVCVLLLILYDMHCQQANITSLNPQDTVVDGPIL